MRAMKKGDRAFFYRSMQDPAVVGVMEIVREAYEDPNDPKQSFVLVDVAPVMPAQREVGLSRSSRTPGSSISRWYASRGFPSARWTIGAWRLICDMAGIERVARAKRNLSATAGRHWRGARRPIDPDAAPGSPQAQARPRDDAATARARFGAPVASPAAGRPVPARWPVGTHHRKRGSRSWQSWAQRTEAKVT